MIYYTAPGGASVPVKATSKEQLYKTVDALRAAEKDGMVVRPAKSNDVVLVMPNGAQFTIREPKAATTYECSVVELPVKANVIEVRRSGESKPLARLPKKAFEALKRMGKPIHTARYVGWLVEKENTELAIARLAEAGIYTPAALEAAYQEARVPA